MIKVMKEFPGHKFEIVDKFVKKYKNRWENFEQQSERVKTKQKKEQNKKLWGILKKYFILSCSLHFSSTQHQF